MNTKLHLISHWFSWVRDVTSVWYNENNRRLLTYAPWMCVLPGNVSTLHAKRWSLVVVYDEVPHDLACHGVMGHYWGGFPLLSNSGSKLATLNKGGSLKTLEWSWPLSIMFIAAPWSQATNLKFAKNLYQKPSPAVRLEPATHKSRIQADQMYINQASESSKIYYECQNLNPESGFPIALHLPHQKGTSQWQRLAGVDHSGQPLPTRLFPTEREKHCAVTKTKVKRYNCAGKITDITINNSIYYSVFVDLCLYMRLEWFNFVSQSWK